jgi:hypothetical protein
MLIALLLCFAGFTALCLSMHRHYSDLLGHKLTTGRRMVLKAVGWLSLGLSLWAGVAARGWDIGLVEWFAVLMASAVTLVFMLPYKPRLALVLAASGLLISPVVAVSQLLV